MEKKKMILCEDDEVILQFMQKKIEHVFAIQNVAVEVAAFTEARPALAYCEKEACDFALLDVGLPEMNGFQLSKRIKELPCQSQIRILFTSALEDIVYQSFQYEPFDFVRKSHLEEDMEKKLMRLLQECFGNYRAYNYKKKERIDLIRGEDGCVYLQEICYFKSERNHLDAFTRRESYRCKGCLKNMAERYSKDLVQTDKQHLVNMHEIKKIQMDTILLWDGRKVPLSRRRRKDVENVYFRFMALNEY